MCEIQLHAYKLKMYLHLYAYEEGLAICSLNIKSGFLWLVELICYFLYLLVYTLYIFYKEYLFFNN